MKGKLLLGSFILILLLYYAACDIKRADYYEPEILASHSNGEHFVGSTTCMECHSDTYQNHLLTAHQNTSAIVNSQNISGSFTSGSNTIQVEEGQIEMKKIKGKYFQQVLLEDEGTELPPKQMDVVIGSGVKGQSFLTWEDEKLFQLQASYYPPNDQWINSPGFPDHLINRPVRDGCLKCHVTYATNLDFSGQGHSYDQEKMIYGIGCEKCHRPSEKHVVFHRENPDVESSRFMLKLDTISRQNRLDVCAQCHSGPRAGIIKGNSFSFLSGERLDEYSRNFYTGQKESDLDVHGNQYGLLKSSSCFLESPEMDCGTCHNPHENQRGDMELFNSKCTNCHTTKTTTCSANSEELNAMGNNCISCHMPLIPSKSMALQLGTSSEQTGVHVRTHRIAIYNSNQSNSENQIDSVSVNELKGFIERH